MDKQECKKAVEKEIELLNAIKNNTDEIKQAMQDFNKTFSNFFEDLKDIRIAICGNKSRDK